MRILLLTPQLPFPPDKGTRIRNFGILSQLARRHEVGVLSFGDPADRSAVESLGRYCRIVGVVPAPRRRILSRAFAALLDPKPDLARRLESTAFAERLGETLAAERWDVVQMEALEMAPYFTPTRRAGVSLVLDAHNAEWVLQHRAARIDARDGRPVGGLYSAVQSLKLRMYEGRIAADADAVVCVSEQDAAAIRAVGRPRRLRVVPNGVDTAATPRRGVEPTDPTILFSGTMDYRPNVDGATWFARDVWPLVRAGLPSARFVVAGRSPTRAVRALASLPGVEVTGTVADMAPLFRDALVYVAPLRFGGGVRLKLLEAFAHGVPVVSTRLGAAGIELTDGREAILSDDPREMAAAIRSLIEQPVRRRSLADAAHKLVRARYDWTRLVPTLDRLYDELLAVRLGPDNGSARAAD